MNTAGTQTATQTRALMTAIPGHPGWLCVFCPPDAVEIYRPDGLGRRYTRKRDDVRLSAVALEAVRDMMEDKS